MNTRETEHTMSTRSQSLIATVCGAGIILSMACATPASADEEASHSYPFVSQSCVSQVKALAQQNGVGAQAAQSLCTATITATETRPQTATSEDVRTYAQQNNLSDADTDELMTAALLGEITYRDWTHSYWGGSLLEKHAGRTFWDGSKAWIATYRGLTGANVCHSEGGIAVGWAVTPLECASPGAGADADAYYRFDASVAFEGSPVTLDIGLHYSTNASGDVSTWQVGG